MNDFWKIVIAGAVSGVFVYAVTEIINELRGANEEVIEIQEAAIDEQYLAEK